MKRPLITAATVAALALVSASVTTADAAPGAKKYKNCTALNKVYPHGVGKVGAKDKTSSGKRPVTNFKRSNALYAANKKSDRDGDKIACEKK